MDKTNTQTLGLTRRTWMALIGITAVTALLAGSLGAFLINKLVPTSTCDTQTVTATVQSSIVGLETTTAAGVGIGSGVIIQANGVILTNHHLVAGVDADGILVVLNDGTRLPATRVGTDPLTDLAVLKVEANKLPALPISWSEPLQVGQPVLAVGSSLTGSGTVTSGIISAVNRNVAIPTASGTTLLTNSIQTSATIGVGNSGGALVTCNGRLIGLNTDLTGLAASSNADFGTAISATTARRISQELINGQSPTHPWLGLTTAEVNQSTADRFTSPAGLYVQSVPTGGPASQVGVHIGDLVTSLNGGPATDAALSMLLLTGKSGDQVPLTVVRNGQSMNLTITLAERRP